MIKYYVYVGSLKGGIFKRSVTCRPDLFSKSRLKGPQLCRMELAIRYQESETLGTRGCQKGNKRLQSIQSLSLNIILISLNYVNKTGISLKCVYPNNDLSHSVYSIHRPDIRFGSVIRLSFASSVRVRIGLAEPNRTSRARDWF